MNISKIFQNLLITAFLFIVSFIEIYGQIQYDRTSFHLEEEIVIFAERLNRDSSNKHRVFVIFIYKNDSVNNSFCFTMSYIYNTSTYEYLEPKYFFEINDEYYTILNEKSCDIDILKSFNPIKIEEEQEFLIKNKLSTQITYRPKAMQYCWEYNFFELKIYQNGDWVPEEEHIYYNYLKKQNNKTE